MQLKRISRFVRACAKLTALLSVIIISSSIVAPSQAKASTTLYYNNALSTSNWSTLGNWWQDSGFSVPAVALPTSSDDVVISANIESNSGDPITIHNLTATGTAVWGNISATILGTGVFNGTSKISSGHITGTVTFNNSAMIALSGQITGDVYLTGNASDEARVDGAITLSDTAHITTPLATTGNVTFTDSSYCAIGTITGNITLSGTANFSDFCEASGNATLNGTSSNLGIIHGNAILNGSSYNTGSIEGDTTFNTDYYSGVTPSGGIFSITGSTNFRGTYSGDIFDGNGNPATIHFSNDTTNYASFSANAVFTDNAQNSATITGNADFYDSSYDGGVVNGNISLHDHSSVGTPNVGNADVYFPVRLPITSPSGTITYHNYPAYFFGWGGDGDWNNLAN